MESTRTLDQEVIGTIEGTTRESITFVGGEKILLPLVDRLANTAEGYGTLKMFEENIFAGFDLAYQRSFDHTSMYHEFSIAGMRDGEPAYTTVELTEVLTIN